MYLPFKSAQKRRHKGGAQAASLPLMRRVKAAGVLPYSKDERGNAWFLLGREKPNSSWGIDSGSWSEFGGSMTDGESAEEGAAREFFEETMGCVFGHKSWVENELKTGQYLLVMDGKTPTGRGYRSFVKYIPFVDYPTKFARYKTLSKKQPHLLEKVTPHCFSDGKIRPNCTEKSSMAWFSAAQMKKAVAKYKDARVIAAATSTLAAAAAVAAAKRKSCYYEPDGIPHLRRGFAMDFDHLLNTSWGKSNFQNDEAHFPLYYTPEKLISNTCQLETIKTESGIIRPVLKTPQHQRLGPLSAHSPAVKVDAKPRAVGKPPLVIVNTEGYSFKKKKRRPRKRREEVASSGTVGKKSGTASGKQWTVVETKRKRKNSLPESSYKPVLPVF